MKDKYRKRSQFGYPGRFIRPRTVAAIDLGTNSCRLLVGRIDQHGLRIIDSFSRVVRLGEGVQKNGVLSQDAMDRTFEALTVCREKIQYNRVDQVRLVTTEACRLANNSKDFLTRISKNLQFNFEVISNEEEARLALSGCSGVLDESAPYAIAFDIGGGSTEVMWLRCPRHPSYKGDSTTFPEVIDWVSLPFGVVTLSEKHDWFQETETSFDQVAQETISLLKDFTTRNQIDRYVRAQQVQMVGTSGTITTLGAIHLQLERYDRKKIDGLSIFMKELLAICETLRKMDLNKRLDHPCIGMGRADLVVSGAAIFQGMCQIWPVSKLRIADRGVREGILNDLAGTYSKKRKSSSPSERR